MTSDSISRRQLAAAAFVALLSPLGRRFPSGLLMVSGPAAWLAAPIAALPVVIMLLFLLRLMAGGRSLGDVFRLALGERLGRAALGLISLWLIFYCGFILRSGAYRFTSTVYPSTAGWIFVVFTAACCLPMVMGSVAALARWAVLLRPLLLAVLLAVFALSLPEMELRGLLRLEASDALPALRSGFTVLNTLSVACYLGFLEGKCHEPMRPRLYLGWAMVLLALTELIVLSCIGVFGTELSTRLNFPFFMLVRDIGLSDSFARMEALIIALWVFADALHVSLLLHIAAENLGGGGKWASAAVTVLACLGGLLLPGDMLGVGFFSERIVPGGNAIIIFGLLPLTAALGRMRKRI